MAKSNRDRIGDILDLLKQGLGPFVLREYKMYYKGSRYLQEIELTLNSSAYSPPHLPDADTALQAIDTQGWLNLMWRQWNDVFRVRLGHAERSYVSELIEARNKWAHQEPFTNDDAYRVADTARRLLESVGSPKEALAATEIARELLRLRFDNEAKKAVKAPSKFDDVPTMTQTGLKPWRLVVEPHPDVANGRYVQAEFAADLAQVVQGKADPEYGDPHEFFRRTYLTNGLRDLLVTGVRRLSGMGGDPVVQLQTSFGGGKTHSMLALYHLLGGEIRFGDIPDGEEIVARVGEIDDHISANRAVIVGTAFDASSARHYDDCTTHTLWGDIAYQLGGVGAYALVEQADRAGVSPGSDTLLKLFEEHGPALVIIDELVAFARNLYGAERLVSGTFDAVMTFIQSLTEAVKRSSDSMLLVSIPESDIEIGGEGGQATLEILAKTIGRLESVWKPVSPTESFEIVRRRLFKSEVDYPARDAVLNAYRDMYRDNHTEYPSQVGESDYYNQMRQAYPIHPELFARLYEDWSTLDRFQRTRGVLRFMATVIHRLWTDNDQSLMIMPASIPLWAPTVHNEITRYLPESWPAIIDTDIDGENSKPFQLDKDVPTLGKYTASRRVARAIFIGSAPSVAAQKTRGIEETRIRLATLQPGEQSATFNDALRRMSNQLTYLYNQDSRYWYDTRPTVNRMAQERVQSINPDAVYMEAVSRLKSVKYSRDDFAGAHVAPQSSADIADEARFRVVVLPPDYGHKKSTGQSKAQEIAKEILEYRGHTPRLHRNMLVFIAPDETLAVAWEQAIREYLAWKSIEADTEILNLDIQQQKQVESSLHKAENTLLSRLQETYVWLIVPTQTEATKPIVYQPMKISGQEGFYERASRKLHQNELVIPRWSPDNLMIELERYLWRDGDTLPLKTLWEYLSRYCYLPRLFSEHVLIDAVTEGVSRLDAPFGYAARVIEGDYQGLVIGSHTTVYLNEHAVLVRADVARQYLDARHQAQTRSTSQPYRPSPTRGNPTQSTPAATPSRPKRAVRYHGTVDLNPNRVNKDVAKIADEIIQHLTGLTGANVTITLEIHAETSQGFDENIRRTINENSNTLKFKYHDFEEE